MSSLEDPRAAIERVDRELIAKLAERIALTRSVGARKGEDRGLPLRDEARERALFEAWVEEGERHGLSPYFLGRILREVLSWSRRDQERFLAGDVAGAPVRVAFQGAHHAYSDLAARKLFSVRGAAATTVGCATFAAALDALEAGEVEYALLPIENTIAGSIDPVYRLLSEREVHVVDEEVWTVEHCLAGLPGATVAGLRHVRSHPVALQQCERFLAGLVGAHAESCFDTAAAADEVAEAGDPANAALCSEAAAEAAGLVVLARDVADASPNVTRFLLLARAPETFDPRLPARTSLLLTLDHKRGALAELLGALAQAGCSLTKLESRPQPHAPWEYLFYVDVEGDAAREPLLGALEAARANTNVLRVLGSYPRRAGVDADASPPDLGHG